jgi:predicted kinase
MNWRAPRGRGQNPQTNNVNYGAHPQYQPPSVAGWPGYQVNYNTLQYGNYPAYPTVDQYGQVYYQAPSAWQNVPTQYAPNPSLMQNVPPPPGEEVQAGWLFKKDNTTRPNKIVVVMRGLPGSGKTHLANLFKQLEIKHFGNTPRIISVDDYFMEEKEVFEVDPATKKSVKKIKMEYSYDADLFESYKTSALKQFEKTVKQGLFSFIIVDNINNKAQDINAYWCAAKSAGYEVYICETDLKDVEKCATKNIHGRSEEEIAAIVKEWEETPSQFAKLILGNLMNSGIFNLNEISEVDMQSDEDKDDLGMDKIEELLESSAKSARWSDVKDKVDDTGSEEARQSASRKRQRVDNDLTNDEDEHKKKKSKWDVVNESESGVVKLTGADMTSLVGAYTDEDTKTDEKKNNNDPSQPKKEESAFVKKQREEQLQFKAKMFMQQVKERSQQSSHDKQDNSQS